MPKKVIAIDSLRAMVIANNLEKPSRPTESLSKTLIHMFRRNPPTNLLMDIMSRAVKLSVMTSFSTVQHPKSHTLLLNKNQETDLLMDIISREERLSEMISFSMVQPHKNLILSLKKKLPINSLTDIISKVERLLEMISSSMVQPHKNHTHMLKKLTTRNLPKAMVTQNNSERQSLQMV